MNGIKSCFRAFMLILQKINDVGVLAPAPHYILTYKRSQHTGHSSQLVSTPIVTNITNQPVTMLGGSEAQIRINR